MEILGEESQAVRIDLGTISLWRVNKKRLRSTRAAEGVRRERISVERQNSEHELAEKEER